MSSYNTGNAVPSIDPRDLDDNATNLDNFVNGGAAAYPDRLGVARKSYAGIEADVASLLINPNLSALAGLTGSSNTLAMFTGAGAMTLKAFTAQAQALLDDTSFAAMLVTLGAAARGANSDITSLTGLTTALSVAQGGTGVATVAAYLALLVTAGAYSKTSILGTVTQASGVPTGAVFETGGTLAGTGKYTKYANGDMEIIKFLAIGTGSTTAKGSIFGSAATAGGAFPVAFVGDLPVIQVSGTDSSGGGWAAMDTFATLTNWGSYSTRNHASLGTTGSIYLTARGKWF
jgi:hypothetical protein